MVFLGMAVLIVALMGMVVAVVTVFMVRAFKNTMNIDIFQIFSDNGGGWNIQFLGFSDKGGRGGSTNFYFF